MKISRLLLLFTVLSFAACQTKSDKDNSKNSIVIEQTSLLAFTDTVQLDTFKVSLIGGESKKMNLLFTITTNKGVQIFKKEIPAKEILDSYLAKADSKSEAEKVKFLKDEVNYFFDEEHILTPAVTEQENPDENAPDKNFYQELKKSKLNGFNYRVGKEIKTYIAWSVKDQKVKPFYICCK